MEEIKDKGVKTPKSKEVTKPTYEQLENWCNQLLMQRNQVAKELRQVTDIVNKLPWLFKVLENKDFFSGEFLDTCIKEIVDIMTPPPVEEKPQEENSEASK